MRSLFVALTAVFALSLALVSRPAQAEPPDPELMARLVSHAEALERMRTHAAYLVQGELDSLDGDGKVDGVRKLVGRVDADGDRSRLVVVSYSEDGKDKADEIRKQVKEANARSKEEREKDHLEMPFGSAAQSRYVFNQIAVDPADPSRVQIGFVPKAPTEHTSEGSVWVDTKTATFLSAGFKLSKPGFFVDYVHVTIEFGETTSLGPAISRVTIDGRGGLLFIHKHFTGTATLSDYRIVP
jgi:hypothetical protein